MKTSDNSNKRYILRIGLITSILAMGIVGVAITNNVIMPNLKYKNAVSLMESGSYDAAATAFEALGDYKDSKEKIAEIETAIVKQSEIGDIVRFGNYSWHVLELTEHSALIITEDCIEDRAYNNDRKDMTWEKSDLRTYLNNEFYNSFSKEEKKYIAETEVVNTDNVQYDVIGGNNTKDKIFLLSVDEVNKYYFTNEEYIGKYSEPTGWWWLRSPGGDQHCASVIYANCNVSILGHYVNYENGVRPALNLKF